MKVNHSAIVCNIRIGIVSKYFFLNFKIEEFHCMERNEKKCKGIAVCKFGTLLTTFVYEVPVMTGMTGPDI